MIFSNSSIRYWIKFHTYNAQFCVIYTGVLNIRSVEFIDINIHEIEM